MLFDMYVCCSCGANFVVRKNSYISTFNCKECHITVDICECKKIPIERTKNKKQGEDNA